MGGTFMAIKEVTPQQAHEILTNDANVVYIDVRTEREFANGHPAGAVNIPVAFPDPARGMMVNADFVKVVEASFPHDKKIIVGCHAAPRSDGHRERAGMVGVGIAGERG